MRNWIAALLFSTACGSAYADQPVAPGAWSPRIAIDVAPVKVRAPYDVQIIREDGETLPTYAARDRFYVQGFTGQRYTIRITNPTDHRVEAVVSVDGLDAVDGETGDLHKRGYIVAPYGTVNVEGFRTSLNDVATFRFSSVDGSYAGQKGKARNVGVIAVALFEEDHPAEEPVIAHGGRYNYEDDLDEGAPRDYDRRAPPPKSQRAESAKKKMAPPPAAPTTTATGAASAPRRADKDDYEADESAGDAAPTNRPGLGTEFGESRYSAASYTRFVRSTARPIAIAELRYNDVYGLQALGINVQPMPDENEIMTRETADPFPGDRFARPAR
ncbi:MAG TPA: hypothetical protein VGC41_05070 [Kofleriaceae bacterium]